MPRKSSPIEAAMFGYIEPLQRIQRVSTCSPDIVTQVSVYSALGDLYAKLGDDVTMMADDSLLSEVVVSSDELGRYRDEPAEDAINADVDLPIGDNPVHRFRPLRVSRMSLPARLRHDPEFALHMHDQGLYAKAYRTRAG